MKRKITTEVEPIRKSGSYKTLCNAFTITRKPGTAEVSVNGYPLSEGEAKTYGGNIGDFYTTELKVVFANTGTKELYLERRKEIE